MIQNHPLSKLAAAGAATALFFATVALVAQQKDDEEDVFTLSPFCVGGSVDVGYGATPGGAQDISFARAQISLGNIPHPNTFRPEGLFSEHDLPLQNKSNCDNLVCVYGEAMPTRILEQPDATVLAQIGFGSGLDSETWTPDPLNLVAVIDKSGSMSGQPLELVRQSLLQVVSQLSPEDQISIVLYGDRSHVHLNPTPVTKSNLAAIRSSIHSIASSGSTNMESGLMVGYRVAEESAPSFKGKTRLMLFTDERPNTGRTDASSFMGLMGAGSEKGFGLTTIGVGRQFGAELANEISSARGGNLFYFPDRVSMVEKFEKEFATMVTELAYDFELTVAPERGYRLAGVYGIPADMLEWVDKRSVRMEISTLFLSLRKGAVFFALAAEDHSDLPRQNSHREVAKVSITYQQAGKERPVSQSFTFQAGERHQASEGLIRGEYLVNQYVSLKKATTEHHVNNDQEKAYQITRELQRLLKNSNDPSLQPEIETVSKLSDKLAFLSGHAGESTSSDRSDKLSGIWFGIAQENTLFGSDIFVRFHGNHTMEVASEIDGTITPLGILVSESQLPKRRKGKVNWLTKTQFKASKEQIDDFPSELHSALYLGGLESGRFHLRGKTLECELYKTDGTTETLTLYRYNAKKTDPIARHIRPSEIDAISGLPKKSQRF